MKRSILGAAALALVLSASTVQAQKPMSFGVALGATMPTGDFGDVADMGFHALGTLAWSPPTLPVGLRFDAMFNQLGGKSSPLAGDFSYRIMGLIANATWGMPMAASPISPYLIGGLGFYQTSVSCDGCPSNSETDLGFNVGVGTKFALSGFGTFAEIRYHKVADGSFIPISFGIMF